MIWLKTLFFFGAVLIYGAAFLTQEQLFKTTGSHLTPVAPAHFTHAVSGYLRQVTAEFFFIKTAVFLGGIPAQTDPESYAPALGHNLQQITTLYPEFKDPYFYTQSYLPHIGSTYAREANAIFANGITAYPENTLFPFFQAVNHFHYLDQPLIAAEILEKASGLPKAPPFFKHFSVVLSAEGGALHAGLFSLKAILATETDEMTRSRYETEIEMFEKAILIQQAVDQYHIAQGLYPDTLDSLVPEFLDTLPTFGSSFELTWNKPVVGLQRPDPKKQDSTQPKPIPFL